MVVRVWAGDVDRSADDFARVEERADRDSGGEAVEEVPPAEVFDCQRRFAFRQNRVSHMILLSSVIAGFLPRHLLPRGSAAGQGLEKGEPACRPGSVPR